MKNESSNDSPLWLLGAVLLVLVAALAMRYGTNVLEQGENFDEPYIRVPIDDLLRRGWSVDTAIDYTETKGPSMIWLYALGGKLVGGDLNDLRLISVVLFAAGVVPLLLTCRACGGGGRTVLLAAAFYVLLPHNASLGQFLMSEPSFVFGSLWLMWVFVWGFGTSRRAQRSIAGPIVFGLVLSILLHLRIHAVAFAAAAVLVAFERDRFRSWPWWLAALLAGLSRVPLWIRWGGLVAPQYQGGHTLGLGPDSLTYLAGAIVPVTALFLWPALVDRRYASRRRLVWVGAGLGLVLALVAQPSLSDTLLVAGRDVRRFLGPIATTHRELSRYIPPVAAQVLLLGILPVVGLGAMAALGVMSWDRPVADRLGVVMRLAFWTLATGCALYGLTRAVVFDRYLLPWAVLLPIVWVAALPRRALAIQGLLLLVIFSWFTWWYLFRIAPP